MDEDDGVECDAALYDPLCWKMFLKKKIKIKKKIRKKQKRNNARRLLKFVRRHFLPFFFLFRFWKENVFFSFPPPRPETLFFFKFHFKHLSINHRGRPRRGKGKIIRRCPLRNASHFRFNYSGRRNQINSPRKKKWRRRAINVSNRLFFFVLFYFFWFYWVFISDDNSRQWVGVFTVVSMGFYWVCIDLE